MDGKNRYRVPSRKWSSWGLGARAVFNEVYGTMVGSPWAFKSPKVEGIKIPAGEWRTTAWNAAWVAADAAEGLAAVGTRVVDCDGRGNALAGRKARVLRAA